MEISEKETMKTSILYINSFIDIAYKYTNTKTKYT